jgi:RNA polymerase sigma factor (sigma-70 family)
LRTAAAVRAGEGEVNAAAAEHLMNGARRRLMRLAQRHTRCPEDAEDAFARTLELALRSCPIAGDMSQVERWATVVLTREAWKIARRYRRKPADSLDELVEGREPGARREDLVPVERTDPSPEERALDAETVREVHAAIDELAPNQRCVIDAYANGWTPAETARALGLTHRQVRRMLERGKRNLRARFGASA